MKDIKQKIAEILLMSEEQPAPEEVSPGEMIETYDEYEFEEIYTDIYVEIRNMEDFYGDKSHLKVALLLESFLLESMVLLKKDPEVIVVESGDDFLRSTSFTPVEEGVLRTFENVVIINSMLELYNQALSELEFTAIDAGIAMVSFPKEEIHCEIDETEGECAHDHGGEAEYGIDLNYTAMKLVGYAGTEEIEPILVNDMAYDMLQEVDKAFFSSNLEKVPVLIEDLVVYQGNIVTEE